MARGEWTDLTKLENCTERSNWFSDLLLIPAAELSLECGFHAGCLEPKQRGYSILPSILGPSSDASNFGSYNETVFFAILRLFDENILQFGPTYQITGNSELHLQHGRSEFKHSLVLVGTDHELWPKPTGGNTGTRKLADVHLHWALKQSHTVTWYP